MNGSNTIIGSIVIAMIRVTRLYEIRPKAMWVDSVMAANIHPVVKNRTSHHRGSGSLINSGARNI